MSRKILALPLLAALALVGCDDSSSSSAAGTCDGYKGNWALDTTFSEEGMSFGMKLNLSLTATSFSSSMYTTFSGRTTQTNASSGTIRDLGSSTLLMTPTTAKVIDDETGTLVTDTDPDALRPDTLSYSFPSAGKMSLGPKSEPADRIVLTCK